MTEEKKATPMYFASLRLKNVKSFGEEQVLNLRHENGAISPWTLILGDNGVGKTTLLKCLSLMIPVKFAEPERFQLAKKLKDKGEDVEWIKEVTKISNKEWEIISNENPSVGELKRMTPFLDSINEDDINAIIRVGKGVRMNIEAELTNHVALNTVPSKENLITIGISIARKEELDEIEDITNTDHLTTAKVEEFNAPNLFAYGASRHMASENLEVDELKDPSYNLFSNTGDLYDAEEVLLRLYNDSQKEKNDFIEEQLKKGSLDRVLDERGDIKFEGKAAKHLRKVKEILTKLLPHIDNTDCIIINPSGKTEGLSTTKIVEVVTPFGKVGLYDLSLGYQTMLAWVVDLAIRMFWQNPDSDNPLEEPAVVIVDEIDLHLHPKWQRTLKEYFVGNFTATQFICTAHSPFIAQASEDENLCVLHESKVSPTSSEVVIENDPYIVKGWRIGQIVTNLIGVDERGPEIEKLEKERRMLIDKLEPLTPSEEVQLKELNSKLEKLVHITDDDDEQKLLEQVRKTAEYLRNNGKLL